MKKKLLFIDHSFHSKTKSSQFIRDILCQMYVITDFFYDPYIDKEEKFENISDDTFDTIVLWQIMPQIDQIKKHIQFKHIAFFPMYDGAPKLDDPIWYQYKDCNIVNFSKTLHEECKAHGFSSYYIQFFPEPKEVKDWGAEKSVFLWQRIDKINPGTVDKVLGFENIDKFYHHQVPDPCHNVIEVENKWKEKVAVSTWFDTKEEMEKYLLRSTVYFAPRYLEGIGMSFLDAMAMGRCVVAPDNPTMNEYIKNGVNGFLYNSNNPQRIELRNVRDIQKNTIKFIKKGFSEWEKNKLKILDWIESDVSKNRNIALIKKNYTTPSLSGKTRKSLPYRAIRKMYRMAKKFAQWGIRRK